MLTIPEFIPLQSIKHLSNNKVLVDLLRIDQFHPIVSGNKWFKLRFYLEEAIYQQKNTIASFGGAYSNHIVALAYTCQQYGLASIGIIRGEQSAKLSHTLQAAIQFGMQLIFVSRTSYNDKEGLKKEYGEESWYWINEGGYGVSGAAGASTILDIADTTSYTDIVCSVGTGTMMAGLIKKINTHQKVIGISALKNNFSITQEVKALLTTEESTRNFEIIHAYHFGGYAKHPPELLQFMHNFWEQERIPTDIVYTGKLMFAITDLLQNNHFANGSKILAIHSGGLQGNLSLSNGLLNFK
jgi:1-aminocyclopropane-1-carboxylate deaminase